MSLGTIVVLLLAGLFCAFVVTNWAAIAAPGKVSLFLFQLDVPAGVVLVGVVVLCVLAFAAYSLSLKARMLVEMRRMDKELRGQREIADQAEASRVAALEKVVRLEASETRALVESLGRALDGGEDARFNGLYAHLGQIDDKLDRMIGTSRSGS